MNTFIIKAFEVFKENQQGAILIGSKGLETGIAIKLIKFKGKKILDGISIDGYTGKRFNTKEKTLGLGISKNIIENELLQFNIGTYVTKPIQNFFYRDIKKDLNFAVGFTGRWKF